MLQLIWDWLTNLEWQRVLPELVGKGLGFLAGFVASWFLLFRRKLRDLQRLQSGDSDDFIFQMHRLSPIPGSQDEFVLLFRNIAPKTTLNELYDNEVARDLIKELAEQTSLGDPILQTQGVAGFELLNDALGHIAGLLAVSPFPRETWLLAMTCEDRHLVRKRCVRCFLIRPDDLRRFSDWAWCCTKVRVEKPWHWFRVVALHCIAKVWQEEQAVDPPPRRDARHEQRHAVGRQAVAAQSRAGTVGGPEPGRTAGRCAVCDPVGSASAQTSTTGPAAGAARVEPSEKSATATRSTAQRGEESR